jgi:hypothetical protein
MNFQRFGYSEDEPRPDVFPIEGTVTMSTDGRCKHISFKEGPLHFPETPGWELAKRRIRCALFIHNTLCPHIWTHVGAGTSLFIYTHGLSHTHVLKRFLLPFTVNTDVASSKFLVSVVGKGGVTAQTTPYDHETTVELMLRYKSTVVLQSPVKRLDRLSKTGTAHSILRLYWDAIYKYTRAWLGAIEMIYGKVDLSALRMSFPNVDTSLYSDDGLFLASILYAITMTHHYVGHSDEMNGTADPGFVGTCVSKVEPCHEPGQCTIMRTGIIADVSRDGRLTLGSCDFPKLACDLPTPFLRAAIVFTEDLAEIDKAIHFKYPAWSILLSSRVSVSAGT